MSDEKSKLDEFLGRVAQQPSNPEGYTEKEILDTLDALYAGKIKALEDSERLALDQVTQLQEQLRKAQDNYMIWRDAHALVLSTFQQSESRVKELEGQLTKEKQLYGALCKENAETQERFTQLQSTLQQREEQP